MSIVSRKRYSTLGIILFGLAVLRPLSTEAQSFTPYSDFQSMATGELDSLQVKLTSQEAASNIPIATLLFGASPPVLNSSLFTPYRRPGRDYSGDDFAPYTFTASVQELKGLIDSVGTLPSVTDGDVDSAGRVSFALLNTVNGTTKVFEAVVNEVTGRQLFDQMLRAMKGNAPGVRSLRTFGCALAVLPNDPPPDVGGSVRVSMSGLRADRRVPRQFVGRVKVTNTSGSTIVAPLTLVVIIKGNASLLDATGKTCTITPAGRPFLDLPVGTGLGAGVTVEKTLRFANPSGSKLDVDFQVVAGAGTR